MFLIGALIGAGASLIGGIMRNKSQERVAEESGERSLQSAREQMAFQERMSNSAVTRRYADLRRAGINPILAGKYDASTPAGAMAQFPMPNMQDVVTPAVNTGLAAGKIGPEIKKIEQEVKKIAADTHLSESQVRRIGYEIDTLVQQVAKSKSEVERNRILNELTGALTEEKEWAIEKAKVMLRWLDMEDRVYREHPDLHATEVLGRSSTVLGVAAAAAGMGTIGVGGAVKFLKKGLTTLLKKFGVKDIKKWIGLGTDIPGAKR